MDLVDFATRSRMMASIRGKDTKPELVVRQYLHAKGFRYRLHSRNLPGKPDLVLRRWSAAVFVHGCFWHGHVGCRYFRLPGTRTEFWARKIHGNIERDEQAVDALSRLGWRVFIVWECALRDEMEAALGDLEGLIRSHSAGAEIFSKVAQPPLK